LVAHAFRIESGRTLLALKAYADGTQLRTGA
jgi:hypothetical protein